MIPNSSASMRPIEATASNIPMADKDPEPDANMTQCGQIWIHTNEQAKFFETEKTRNGQVIRSPWFGMIDE